MNSEITIVTAFFDIGRESWSVENGHPDYLFRTSDTYLSYFEKIASLNNEMVIFTSDDFADKIREIRAGKPTKIIIFDYKNKLYNIKRRVDKIQSSDSFKSKVPDIHIINPEYWSADYALVTNLKSYFVTKAIDLGYVSNDLAAWMDFGYCRDYESLNNISTWKYNFERDKVHVFNLKKIPPLTQEIVEEAIFNNKVYIIGGVTIADKKMWYTFHDMVYKCQRELMSNSIVDDDQGVYLFAFLKKPDMFKTHFLGKDKWRTLFYTYDVSARISIVKRVKKIFGYL